MRKGDHLPLVPPHGVNGGIDFPLTQRMWVGLDGIYVNSQYLRGDETNEHRRLAPYFVANTRIEYQTKNVDIFVRLENMFDTAYESYGALFENTLDGTGVERFLGPSAPLGVFSGIRVKF